MNRLSQATSPPASSTAAIRPPHVHPICVDLDGTLVKSDTLVDSLLVLLRTHPAQLIGLPASSLRGKAAFKAYVTAHVSLDVVHLPYNRPVLQYLQEEHRKGRHIYLATGANEALARRVADHLGIFTDVLGSDNSTNLTGNKKLNGLRNRIGDTPFDYIGNDSPDLPLLAQAAEAMVANPSLRLRRKMRPSGLKPARVFQERRHPIQSALKCIRPHQWAKNLLIFLPLLLSHDVTAAHLLAALVAFCCLSFTASATYVINDLLDIEADRHHPRKRLRPFASGDLSAFSGLGVVAVFLTLSFAGARLLPLTFSLWLLVYIVATLSYSLYLKRVALLDVLVLSGLYTLRLLIGGAATHTVISHWLAGFAIFLFLSLAIVKRFAELENLRASGAPPKNGRGYLVADMEQIRAFGTASAFAAVVVFANYISGQNVISLYRHPAMLWLIVPLMILWLCRVWLLASRGELSEDPVVFALTDRVSLLIGGAVAVITALAV